MSKKQKKTRKKAGKFPPYIIVLALVAYAASLLLVGLDFINPPTFDISVGMPSPADFSAHRQVEDVYRTNINRDAAADAVSPQFQIDAAINDEILENLEVFFALVGVLRAEHNPILSPFDPLLHQDREPPVIDPSRVNVPLDQQDLEHMVAGDSPTFARFIEALTYEVQTILEANITSDTALTPYIATLQVNLLGSGLDNVHAHVGYVVASQFLRPNMVINEAETERLRAEAAAEADVLFFQMGESIVRAGDIVNQRIFMALTELGYLGVNMAEFLTSILGSFFAITIIFVILILYLHLFMPEIIKNKKQAFLLFTLYVLAITLIRLMVPLPFYFTPIMLFAILCAILIDTRLSILLVIITSSISLIIEPMGTSAAIYALVNGVFAALIAKRIVVRSNMWAAAIIFILLNALMVVVSYFLFGQVVFDEIVTSIIMAMIGGVMTITLAYGSLPLWESFFSVVTQNTLLELTDPNNPLLRRLLIETPGTYHHSLVVANLSEAACYDIGANHVLARVGAYYHDIGKMTYPQYFAENQTDFNPHDTLPPRKSVEVINQHITGGLVLAQTYKLPSIVKNFIEEHHGTSMLKVFFHKEQIANPDIEVSEVDFRYKHRIPQSPETAVVMLADTCEAAVRSVFGKGEKKLEEMEAFVRRLIKDKLDDGQLDASGLAIKDLDTIALSFMRVFKGMHHDRVPYPSIEETNEGANSNG
ncbi:MAG: HDIG domain-containing protein [Defluviitaleaceae bacterium]|nr:HDIG domain-containing protein [Defluviitaleaceae bacterium]